METESTRQSDVYSNKDKIQESLKRLSDTGRFNLREVGMSKGAEKREFQPELPGFENLPRQELKRRVPWPRREPERKLSGYELAGHHLDLRFRGEINRWLTKLEFPLDEVLNKEEEELVRLYLWPHQERWLNQGEVAAQVGWSEKSVGRVSFGIKFALLKVFRREKIGPQAIERLKLPRFLYRSLLEKEIFTWKKILNLDGEQIRQICGSEFGFEILRQTLASQGVNWNSRRNDGFS